MKTIIKAVGILSLLLAVGCTETEQVVKKDQPVPETRLYTAYNIWKVKNLMLRRCINYKHGYDIIPAGTEVRKVKIGSDRDGRESIKINTVKYNRE